MRPQVVSISLAAGHGGGAVAAAQSAAGAQDLVINGSDAAGGVATFPHQRRVTIISVGNDSGITFTIYGTRDDGGAVSEVVAGPNATTATSSQDFRTVTRIATSGATAGNVTSGGSAVGDSVWQWVSQDITPFAMSFGCIVTGTINYEIEYTYDDPNSGTDGNIMAYPPQSKVPTAWPLAALGAKTANAEVSIGSPTLGPISAWRVKVNSGAGTVVVTATQAGNPQ